MSETLYSDAAERVHRLPACPRPSGPGEPCLDCVAALGDLESPSVGLFADEEITPWLLEWQNMPEYSHRDLEPKYQVLVSFATAADVVAFGEAIGQALQPNGTARQLRSLWFPPQDIARYANKRYIQRPQ